MTDEEFVSFFIPPNLTWKHAYEDLIENRKFGKDKQSQILMYEIEQRLKYEIMLEYGLTGKIGRTLEKSGCSVLSFDSKDITAIAEAVQERSINELGVFTSETIEDYERMVAAYLIGCSITKEDLAANPYLKFAEGETDTGVIISYNTEGPKNSEVNAETAVLFPNAISINPLNWKRDETYAPASENLGSLVLNEETGEIGFGDIGADAQINIARGVVITNAKADPMPEDAAKVAAEFFGPDGRHGEDYIFFYNNLKDNANKRVAAYLANR